MKTTLYFNSVPNMGPLDIDETDILWFFVELYQTFQGNFIEIAWDGTCMGAVRYRPQRHD